MRNLDSVAQKMAELLQLVRKRTDIVLVLVLLYSRDYTVQTRKFGQYILAKSTLSDLLLDLNVTG